VQVSRILKTPMWYSKSSAFAKVAFQSVVLDQWPMRRCVVMGEMYHAGPAKGSGGHTHMHEHTDVDTLIRTTGTSHWLGLLALSVGLWVFLSIRVGSWEARKCSRGGGHENLPCFFYTLSSSCVDYGSQPVGHPRCPCVHTFYGCLLCVLSIATCLPHRLAVRLTETTQSLLSSLEKIQHVSAKCHHCSMVMRLPPA
jgi:hypothetical protein